MKKQTNDMPPEHVKASGRAKRHNRSGRGHRQDAGDRGYGVSVTDRFIEKDQRRTS